MKKLETIMHLDVCYYVDSKNAIITKRYFFDKGDFVNIASIYTDMASLVTPLEKELDTDKFIFNVNYTADNSMRGEYTYEEFKELML